MFVAGAAVSEVCPPADAAGRAGCWKCSWRRNCLCSWRDVAGMVAGASVIDDGVAASVAGVAAAAASCCCDGNTCSCHMNINGSGDMCQLRQLQRLLAVALSSQHEPNTLV